MKIAPLLLFVSSLTGCSALQPAAAPPQHTVFNLDGTLTEDPSKNVRRPRSIISPSRASDITAGTETARRKTEEELYAEIKKFKADTPEWRMIRDEIDEKIAAQSFLDPSRLMICRRC